MRKLQPMSFKDLGVLLAMSELATGSRDEQIGEELSFDATLELMGASNNV